MNVLINHYFIDGVVDYGFQKSFFPFVTLFVQATIIIIVAFGIYST
jgi:hypothetical protein